MAVPTKLEFSVRMVCQDCADAVTKSLSGVEGIESFGVDLGVETVVVTTTLPSQKVLDLIESTGRPAVLQGMGGAKKANHLGAAVAMMSGGGAMGVNRLVQVTEDRCVIEGTVDGLQPAATFALNIHELGDLSQGCDSCGDVFDMSNSSKTKYGELTEVTTDENGRAMFRMETPTVKVWDIIGRSMVLHNLDDRPITRVACGIIARSSGLFENAKRICACDGVSIWDERSVPAAGSARGQHVSADASIPSAQL